MTSGQASAGELEPGAAMLTLRNNSTSFAEVLWPCRPLLHAMVSALVAGAWGVELDRVKCDKATAFCGHVVNGMIAKGDCSAPLKWLLFAPLRVSDGAQVPDLLAAATLPCHPPTLPPSPPGAHGCPLTPGVPLCDMPQASWARPRSPRRSSASPWRR